MQISIVLTPEAAAVVKAAIADTDQNANDFVLDLVNKTCEQKKVAFARQRLNRGKQFIHASVHKGIKGFESLEAVYQNAGMSNDVDTFGGIKKVYTEIYDKSGLKLSADKLRINNVVAVNK